jgi:hypothetical protein
MPATPSAPSSINDLFKAGKNAKDNAYVQRLLQDEDLRENAIAALQSARSAFDRANSKNWDANKLATDKKLRKHLQSAALGLKETGEELADGPKKKRHPIRKLLLLAIVGGAVAMVASPDVRKKVLDALFGAEEEFEYKSSTTSANGSS